MFPLKLSTFERCMLADDSPAVPMAYPIEMRFSGELDVEAFREAVAKAAKLHPLTTARVEQRGRAYFWQFSSEPPPVQWVGLGERATFDPCEFIDLRSEGGLRIWAASEHGTTELRFQFHHSISDGVGAYRFIEDVLVYYDQAVRGAASTATIRPLEPGLLSERDRYMPWWLMLVRLPVDLLSLVVGSAKFFLCRPVRIAQPEIPPVDQQELRRFPDLPRVNYLGPSYARIRQAAKVAGVSVNDVLAAACFFSIRQWNEQYSGGSWRPIRIMIAFDLRGPSQEPMPAANVVSMANIDHWVRKGANPRRLMRSIHFEVQLIKRLRWSLTFIHIAKIIGLVPGLDRFLARTEACATTAIFSTVWRIFAKSTLTWQNQRLQAGNLVLDEISSAAPVNRTGKFAISGLSYGDQLTVIVHYHRKDLTPARGAEFLENLRGQLESIVAELVPAPA